MKGTVVREAGGESVRGVSRFPFTVCVASMATMSQPRSLDLMGEAKAKGGQERGPLGGVLGFSFRMVVAAGQCEPFEALLLLRLDTHGEPAAGLVTMCPAITSNNTSAPNVPICGHCHCGEPL